MNKVLGKERRQKLKLRAHLDAVIPLWLQCVSLSQKVTSSEEMSKKAIALSSANAMTFETAHVIESDYKSLLPRCHVEEIK